MEVQIRYFAAAREATGLGDDVVEAPDGSTVADVRDLLVARHPALAGALAGLRFAVDESFVREDTPVPPGAVLALIPPVGGG